MRAVGVVERATGSNADHICWEFRGADEFRALAVAFLREGLDKNEQLMFVGDGTEAELHAALTGLGDVDAMRASGALLVASTRSAYAGQGALDRVSRVRGYRELTEASLRAGYSGLRLVADATMLAADPAARRRMVEYEFDVDRVMAQFPMTAVCAYDASVVGDGVRDLCVVHPCRHASADPGFCLSQQTGGLRLVGEVDLANVDLFSMALDVAAVTEAHVVCIDLAGLDFIDVRGLAVLDAYAGRLAASARMLQLTAAPDSLIRYAKLLALPGLAASLGPTR